MVRRMLRALAACACAVFLTAPGGALDKDGKNDVVGAVWSFQITDGKDVHQGQFRVHKYDVFKGTKKVGKVQPKGSTETTLVFTELEHLNGKAVLRKVGVKPAVWKGTLSRSDGTEWQMTVSVKDR